MKENELVKVKDAFLLFLNIRSLRCHHDQLSAFIEGFSTKPLVTALCETWLTDNDPTSLYKINGFSNIVTTIFYYYTTILYKINGFSNIVKPKNGGGCAFFVNENIDFTVKHLGDQNEGLTITIKLKYELQKITVIYRSHTFAISSFLELFENYLTTVHHLKGDHIVCGDFNINFLGSHNSRFFNLLKSFNLNLQIHLATRVPINSEKRIDHIFSDKIFICNTVRIDVSDNYALLIRANNSTEKICVAKILYRKLDKLAESEKVFNYLFLLYHEIKRMFETKQFR